MGLVHGAKFNLIYVKLAPVGAGFTSSVLSYLILNFVVKSIKTTQTILNKILGLLFFLACWSIPDKIESGSLFHLHPCEHPEHEIEEDSCLAVSLFTLHELWLSFSKLFHL